MFGTDETWPQLAALDQWDADLGARIRRRSAESTERGRDAAAAVEAALSSLSEQAFDELRDARSLAPLRRTAERACERALSAASGLRGSLEEAQASATSRSTEIAKETPRLLEYFATYDHILELSAASSDQEAEPPGTAPTGAVESTARDAGARESVPTDDDGPQGSGGELASLWPQLEEDVTRTEQDNARRLENLEHMLDRRRRASESRASLVALASALIEAEVDELRNDLQEDKEDLVTRLRSVDADLQQLQASIKRIAETTESTQVQSWSSVASTYEERVEGALEAAQRAHDEALAEIAEAETRGLDELDGVGKAVVRRARERTDRARAAAARDEAATVLDLRRAGLEWFGDILRRGLWQLLREAIAEHASVSRRAAPQLESLAELAFRVERLSQWRGVRVLVELVFRRVLHAVVLVVVALLQPLVFVYRTVWLAVELERRLLWATTLAASPKRPEPSDRAGPAPRRAGSIVSRLLGAGWVPVAELQSKALSQARTDADEVRASLESALRTLEEDVAEQCRDARSTMAREWSAERESVVERVEASRRTIERERDRGQSAVREFETRCEELREALRAQIAARREPLDEKLVALATKSSATQARLDAMAEEFSRNAFGLIKTWDAVPYTLAGAKVLDDLWEPASTTARRRGPLYLDDLDPARRKAAQGLIAEGFVQATLLWNGRIELSLVHSPDSALERFFWKYYRLLFGRICPRGLRNLAWALGDRFG